MMSRAVAVVMLVARSVVVDAVVDLVVGCCGRR